MAYVTRSPSPGKDTAVNYSTLLTLLLTTPADQELPLTLPQLAPTLIPHLQDIVRLLQDFRSQPVTPAGTHDFERQLQQRLRQLGLELCDWTFNHLEAEQPQDMPARLDCNGERYRRRQRSPNTIATLFGSFTLHRYLYEDREPGNPCLFPLEQSPVRTRSGNHRARSAQRPHYRGRRPQTPACRSTDLAAPSPQPSAAHPVFRSCHSRPLRR